MRYCVDNELYLFSVPCHPFGDIFLSNYIAPDRNRFKFHGHGPTEMGTYFILKIYIYMMNGAQKKWIDLVFQKSVFENVRPTITGYHLNYQIC